MTKKDYVAIAEIIKYAGECHKDNYQLTCVKRELCGLFQADNPRFDRDKFLVACEPEE